MPPAPAPRDPDPSPSSVGRALLVVEVVAEAGDGVSAKSIARRLGLSLPTTYRLVATLVEQGYLVRLREVHGYGLGYRISALHGRLLDQLAPPGAVRAVLHEVHRQLGAATCYAVRRESELVATHLEECPVHPVPGRLRTGVPIDPHATATGKVLLAGLDRRRTAAFLTRPLERLTPHTITDPVQLGRELSEVRELGVAAEVQESEPGWAGVAAPVRGPAGAVIAAFGVSVGHLVYARRRGELEQAVRDGAARVSAALAGGRTA